jgi:Ca2+-binding RTX toxin-like protein
MTTTRGNTMSFHTSRCRRWAATAIVSLLAAGTLAASAPAQHRALELVSTGPAGGNGGFDAHAGRLSDDGTRAFFQTNESLVSADADGGALDVYERAGGQTTLVSTGPAGGDLPRDAFGVGMSADGTRVFFTTAESLVSADSDVSTDLYERAGGETTLLSTGPAGGNGRFDYVVLQGASEDGSHVVFETYESLVSADTDAQRDLYERAGGQTTLVSTGPAGGNSGIPPIFEGASADGTRAFFRTSESLVSADTDTWWDVYERAGGQTTLVSADTQTRHALFAGASADGSRVFLETDESLVSADTDLANDVYERSGGQVTLVSTGPADAHGAFPAVFRGASQDGSRVFFDSGAALVGADTDTAQDSYERAGGQTTLLSTGPAGGNGALDASLEYGHVSRDGTSVVFRTNESLVNADTDAAQDLYQRAEGQTALVSAGPAGGNGDADAWLTDASADGSRVFFETDESLVSIDTDESYDVYERAAGQTTLVSIGPAGGNGARSAGVWAASDDGTRVLLETNEPLLSSDTDPANDMYLSRIMPPDNPAPRAPESPRTTPKPVPAPPGPLPGACANLRTGTAGRDTLTGAAFGDRLRGLAGNDVLAGLAGDDCLSGGAGNDRLRGGAGNDRLSGGAGNDRLRGGAGNDRINARDGRRETVRCGGGKDRVSADRSDRTIGCERIARR